MRFRDGQPADAPAVIDLLKQGFESYRAFAPPGWEPPDPGPEEEMATERVLGYDEVWYVIAEDERGHAAQCGFTPAHERRNMQGPRVPGTAHFWQLFVREDLWGSGIAGDLHERAVDAMRERGYTRARLLTPAGQRRARRFYERRGWREAPFTIEAPPDLGGLPLVQYELEV
jgi:GNAT superfamily N-acetyltransferase